MNDIQNFSTTASFLWSVADLLRGDFKQSQYGRIILPFTLLRRLECVLAPTKQAVLAEYEKRKDSDLPPRSLSGEGRRWIEVLQHFAHGSDQPG